MQIFKKLIGNKSKKLILWSSHAAIKASSEAFDLGTDTYSSVRVRASLYKRQEVETGSISVNVSGNIRQL